MKKVLIAVIISFLLLFGFVKYRNYRLEQSLHGQPAESSWLIGDFKSYTSFGNVKKQLKNSGYKFRIIYRSKGEYKGYNYYYFKVKVRDYAVMNIKGNLELSFFNDHLLGFDFASADINQYKKILKKDKRVKFINSTDASIEPRTVIFFKGKNASEFEQPVVTGYDTQLNNDSDYWINGSYDIFGPN